MTEFILGTAGSGKSTLIYNRIASDLSSGKKVILIVPEQTAVSSEAALCERIQSLGIPQTELEILNFKRLCNRIFREFGGIAYNSISGGAKAIMLWKALFSTAPYLKRYKNELENAKQFVPMLLSAITELKTYGVSPKQLISASEETADEDAILSEKLHDLALIYIRYISISENSFSDPSDDLYRVSDTLSRNSFFSGYSVYFDSFAGFSPAEYSVLKYVFMQAEKVTVSLCISENDSGLSFENVKKTLKELKKLSENYSREITVTNLENSYRFSFPELSYLEKNLWKLGETIPYDGEASAIRTVTADSPYQEAEFIANDITKKIRDGALYRDFAVLAANIEDYRGIIDAVFYEYSLPCHISLKNELCEKPIFKAVLSALNIKNNGWNTEDVVIFMKTGFASVSAEECYELETYAYQWSIFGKRWYDPEDWCMNPEGFSDSVTEESYAKLQRINQIRKKLVSPLVKLFEAFDGSRTVKELCLTVYEFLIETEADQKISKTNDNDEIRLWNRLCDSLDTLAEVIPDIKADTVLFANLFTLVVNQTNVGNLPAAIDEITLGSANRIITDNVKHIYLIGVNEGVFPPVTSQNGIFSDNDKLCLDSYGITLSPDSSVTAVNDLFDFYSAVTSAAESVTLICSSADPSGAALKPSTPFLRIKELFPRSEHILYRNLPIKELIQNKKASFAYSSTHKSTPEALALSEIYRNDPNFAPLLSEHRQPLVSENEKIESDTASRIFSGDVALTQSRLDSYVLCSFGYQCDYVLKLKPTEKYEFRPSDTGTLVHKILENFFGTVCDGDGKLSEITEERKNSLVDEIISDYLSGIFGKNNKELLSERLIQLFRRLKRSVMILIDNLIEEFSQSEFVPRFFEMPINKSGDSGTVDPLEIPLPDGNRAYIYGTADRVDICKRGNDVYVRVVDYKTGKKDFSLYDIELGLNLQMLLYLFSIWKDKSGSFRRSLGISGEIIPAGVLYCKANPANVSVTPQSSDSEILSAVAGTLKRNGLLVNDEEILRLMEKKLSGKFIPVTMKKDGGFSTSLSLKSLEGFGQLLDSITKTVSDIASLMKSGEASAKPMKNKRQDACKYCPHASICRNPSALISKNSKG